jgi:hypothetical protein
MGVGGRGERTAVRARGLGNGCSVAAVIAVVIAVTVAMVVLHISDREAVSG